MLLRWEALGTTYCAEEHDATFNDLSMDGGRSVARDDFVAFYIDWLFGSGSDEDEAEDDDEDDDDEDDDDEEDDGEDDDEEDDDNGKE